MAKPVCRNEQQSRATHNPAKAVQYACHLLKSYGVAQLSPELLRQAKYDAATSCQPLLLALHELTLLVLAGLPSNSAEALARLKQQLQQETLDGPNTTLPHAGRLLLLHCLAVWGCPAGLIAQLALPQPSSRAALLTLCWLIAHAQLFEKALQQLQIPPHLLQLLPPYPQDTSLTPHAQSKCWAAASAARQHHQHIQQLLQDQAGTNADAAGSSSSSSSAARRSSSRSDCWQAVQTAAHHVLASYRATSLRLQQLTCLAEAREKQLHALQQAQQHEAARSPHRAAHHTAAAGSTSGRCRGSNKQQQVLSAYELHLLSSPSLLQQHVSTLTEAVSLLQQQEECRQHAATFFAWATSAIAAVQQSGHTGAAAAVSTGSQAPAASQSSYRAATTAAVQQQQGRSRQPQPPATPGDLLLPPSVKELLPLVQQLPLAHTRSAAEMLGKVQRQLRQAASAAGIAADAVALAGSLHTGMGDALDAGSSDTEQPRLGHVMPPAMSSVRSAYSAGLSMAADQLSAAMAECTVASQTHQASELQQAYTDCTAPYTQAAAAAMVEAGIVPAACISELQELPSDIAQVLLQLQQFKTSQEEREHARLTSVREALRCCSWKRQLADPQQTPKQQQQQQQQQLLQQSQSPGRRLAAASSESLPSAAGTSGVVTTAGEEVARLNGLALQVAKLLAKARAANKQRLAAAAQALLLTDNSTGCQQMVLYQD